MLWLADAGKTVLLVSTDAASNLDQMLGIELRNAPVPVPGAPGLSVLNIDLDHAAESYRQRVLAQMAAGTSEAERATVREQLSGACTTEIASFDEFAFLLSGDAACTKIILVMLAEVTPVSQAAALQEDLRRARIEPCAWVINKSVLGAGTHDPLLAARRIGKCRQIERLAGGLAQHRFTPHWLSVPPIGFVELGKLVSPTSPAGATSG